MSTDQPGTGDHQDHDGRDAAHGPEPLTGIDPAPMHQVVDELTNALHAYVDTAAGVRAEFGAAEADEDPRVLALETQVSALNARLFDLLHSRLGMHAELTGMVWEDTEDTAEPEHDEQGITDEFHLGFVVGLPAGPTDQTADAALGLIDNGGADLVERLIEAGFTVQEWGSSRGAPMGFDDEDDGDDEP